jgi:hypothetical protein
LEFILHCYDKQIQQLFRQLGGCSCIFVLLGAIWESKISCRPEAGHSSGLLLLLSIICCSSAASALLYVIQLYSCLQGVKFALNAAQVPAVSKLDHDTLHLVWTEEKLQQQLDALDRQWEMLVYISQLAIYNLVSSICSSSL